MTRFRLAIFDLAGTTVKDTNTVGACLQRALAEVGVHAPMDDVNAVMGIRKPIAIRILLEKHGHSAPPELVEKIDQDFRERMIETYRTSPDVGEIPGAKRTFRGLRDLGIKVAVNTGFDRETTDILLERMSWGKLIDASITSDEVENGRPHPDMILALCARLSVQPEDVIKVGDTPADIQEGIAARVGLNLGVSYGTHTEAQLLPYGPDGLLSDLTDLLNLDL